MRALLHFFAAVLSLAATPLAAHEFWLDVTAHQLAPGDTAEVHLRVGENLKGSAYAYIPRNFTRFDVILDGETSAVDGRAGDLPAMSTQFETHGLHVVAHVTRAYQLTYKDWEKFENFARHKDFEWALQAHRDRGLALTDFRERYVRYAKALIGVGDSKGQDAETGMETEIIALTNPYTDDLSNGMQVRVLYQGTPRANAQVELFEEGPDGTVEVTLHRTGPDGQARVPVKPGHRYLVDAVVLRALEPETENAPVWESLWASLTFATPR